MYLGQSGEFFCGYWGLKGGVYSKPGAQEETQNKDFSDDFSTVSQTD